MAAVCGLPTIRRAARVFTSFCPPGSRRGTISTRGANLGFNSTLTYSLRCATDGRAASSDRSVDVAGQSRSGGVPESWDFAVNYYRWRKEFGGLELDVINARCG